MEKHKLALVVICLFLFTGGTTMLVQPPFSVAVGDGYVGIETTDGQEGMSNKQDDVLFSESTATSGGAISYAHIKWNDGSAGTTQLGLWDSNWNAVAKTGDFTPGAGGGQDDIPLLSNTTITLGATYYRGYVANDAYCEPKTNSGFGTIQEDTDGAPSQVLPATLSDDRQEDDSEGLTIWFDNSAT